ncbi:beta-1,4-galactosyltransferase galt-1, partial [Patella vulgata]|uniref:beta-1,4-galactosyltransferase galt-1 n=1 Tax=Patella vulgata TaxID=6465 RepID=UPI00217F622F
MKTFFRFVFCTIIVASVLSLFIIGISVNNSIRFIRSLTGDEKNYTVKSGFQPVGDVHESYVYSAFYDNRDAPVIRIVAILRDHLTPDVFKCVSHTVAEQHVFYPAVLEYIPEPRWGYKYRSGIITCKLSNSPQKSEIISVVSSSTLETEPMKNLSNYLHVQKHTILQRNFTRCVPSFYDFHDKMALIQMMETDRMFGMEMFIMYDFRESTVNDVLRFYQRNGVVKLQQWNLPINTSDIHYYGQLAHVHDCLYRNMHQSKYVLFADVDEVVVSPVFKTWHGITDKYFQNKNCAAASFTSAFFPTFFNSTTKNFTGRNDAMKYSMTYFLKTTHAKVLPKQGARSKVLVKPEFVSFMEIHKAAKFYNKAYHECLVSTNEALLHHYRTKYSIDMRTPYAEDNTMHTLSE